MDKQCDMKLWWMKEKGVKRIEGSKIKRCCHREQEDWDFKVLLLSTTLGNVP